MRFRIPKRWYTKKPAIITLLITFFPLGLPLMWKFSGWTKKTKWIISGVFALGLIFVLTGAYNAAPSIVINNAKDGKIITDSNEYEIIGDLSSMKIATLTVNKLSVPILNGSKFSYKVSLNEGDNTFSLVATNSNGSTNATVTIHRTTQAELASRLDVARVAAEEKVQQGSSKIVEVKTTSAKSTAPTNTPSTPKLKHSYDDFYAWFTTTRKDVDIVYNNLPHLYSGSNYQIITATCQDIDSSFGSQWITCMQEGYKNYLRPDTFDNDNWMGDYSTMVGDMNDLSFSGRINDQYTKTLLEAKTIYNRLAVTN